MNQPPLVSRTSAPSSEFKPWIGSAPGTTVALAIAALELSVDAAFALIFYAT